VRTRGKRRVLPSSWISVSRVARSGDSYQKTSKDWSAIWCARPRHHGQVLPRRWVVERTFAWLGRYRRLSKNYEALPGTEEAWIDLAMIRQMLARLTR
jgi:transposase